MVNISRRAISSSTLLTFQLLMKVVRRNKFREVALYMHFEYLRLQIMKAHGELWLTKEQCKDSTTH